jgi:hypothetical protein
MAKSASKNTTKPAQELPNKYRPNFWGMWQNVLIASLQKGQFLLGVVGLIIVVSLLKLESKEVYNIYKGIFVILKSFYLLGWVLTFILTGLWYIFAKKTNNIHARQVNKLLEDNQKLQDKLLNKA